MEPTYGYMCPVFKRISYRVLEIKIPTLGNALAYVFSLCTCSKSRVFKRFPANPINKTCDVAITGHETWSSLSRQGEAGSLNPLHNF